MKEVFLIPSPFFLFFFTSSISNRCLWLELQPVDGRSHYLNGKLPREFSHMDCPACKEGPIGALSISIIPIRHLPDWQVARSFRAALRAGTLQTLLIQITLSSIPFTYRQGLRLDLLHLLLAYEYLHQLQSELHRRSRSAAGYDISVHHHPI